jgi:cytochrome c peroxidase
MSRRAILLLFSGALVLAGILFFRTAPAPKERPARLPALSEFTDQDLEKILQHSPLGPPPADPTNLVADRPEAAHLGQALFFDARFSKTGTVACSTCHLPSRGFTDGKGLPDVFPIDRNVPSLWNVSYNRWFFWDGRSDSLWSQALKPLENPKEQGGTRLQFAHLVLQDPRLRDLYERVFGPIGSLDDPKRFPPAGGPLCRPEGGTLHLAWMSMTEPDRDLINRVFANLGKAIAAYERRLVSRRSPFDIFVEGVREADATKLSALSSKARKGLKLFVGRGNCRLCHSGPTFTDGEFHNLGIPAVRGGPTADRYSAIGELRRDPFNAKGSFSDDPAGGGLKLDYLAINQDLWGQVKTPSLRNVARTAPYMHQGQFKSLPEVVAFYSTLKGMGRAGHHERAILSPVNLTPEESDALVAFLESLTDEKIDESLLKPLP